MNTFVYIKLLSGDTIPIDVSLPCSSRNLCDIIPKYLDDKDIEPGRISLFDTEYQKIEPDKNLVSDSTYNVFIDEYKINISFYRTIRINHIYSQIPKKAVLEIENMGDIAYRYIYNELDYICRGSLLIDGHYFGNEFYGENPHILSDLLNKYDLSLFKDEQDFREINDETKINLIRAYMKECLCLDMIIDSYIFL